LDPGGSFRQSLIERVVMIQSGFRHFGLESPTSASKDER
jgi:hypothetical protein